MAIYRANADWSPLMSDPAPGDVAGIQALARNYGATAEAIKQAADKLNTIKETGAYHSKAVEQFKELGGDTGEQIMRAHGRYDTTATKVAEYAGRLAELQERAAQALQNAVDAKESARLAQNQVDNYTAGAPDDADPSVLTGLNRTNTDAQQAATKASGAGAALSEEWMKLGNEYAKAINDAIHDDVRTTFWDKVVDVMNAIGKIADIVAQVAGILALVLSWVPVLGQALAAVALVAGLVSLLAKTLNAIDTGEGWMDVIWAAVGVATGGLGKVLGPILKSSKADLIKNLVAKPGATGVQRSGAYSSRAGRNLQRTKSRNQLMREELKAAFGNPWRVTKSFGAGMKKSVTDIGKEWKEMAGYAAKRGGTETAGAWATVKATGVAAKNNAVDEAVKYVTNPYQFFLTKSVEVAGDLKGVTGKGSLFLKPENMGVTVVMYTVVGVNVTEDLKKRFEYSGGVPR